MLQFVVTRKYVESDKLLDKLQQLGIPAGMIMRIIAMYVQINNTTIKCEIFDKNNPDNYIVSVEDEAENVTRFITFLDEQKWFRTELTCDEINLIAEREQLSSN